VGKTSIIFLFLFPVLCFASGFSGSVSAGAGADNNVNNIFVFDRVIYVDNATLINPEKEAAAAVNNSLSLTFTFGLFDAYKIEYFAHSVLTPEDFIYSELNNSLKFSVQKKINTKSYYNISIDNSFLYLI